ncbi:MAG: hypothetical protein WDM81_17360 [Rhizomicrobium sp.]
MHVQPGYEAALAATLGDDLQAPLDEASPHHWRDLGGYDVYVPLPVGAKPLGDFVKAPDALHRRLALTGVVFPDQGKTLQAFLQPGQRLVSPRGDLWRWDGYAASADAPSAAAVRLAQRNRLAALDSEIEAAKERRATVFAAYSAARDAANAAREAERAAEREERGTDQALIAAQDFSTKAARAAAERASQLASLEAEIRRLTQSHEAALDSRRNAEAELEQLGDGRRAHPGQRRCPRPQCRGPHLLCRSPRHARRPSARGREPPAPPRRHRRRTRPLGRTPRRRRRPYRRARTPPRRTQRRARRCRSPAGTDRAPARQPARRHRRRRHRAPSTLPTPAPRPKACSPRPTRPRRPPTPRSPPRARNAPAPRP